MQESREYVRMALCKNELTQVWLIRQLEKKGVITDKTEMCSVLKGTRRGDKAETIISTAVKILKDYEERRNNGYD